MRGGRGRKLIGIAIVAGAATAAVKALRGDPAPQFSTHPTVTGGPSPRTVPVEPEPLQPAPSPHPADPDPHLRLDPAAPDAPTAPLPVEDAVADEAAWVEPVDGACPDGFPIKAKLSSGIFHQPGGLAYERTKPDRCYPTAAAAEADGLRAAKR